MTSYIKHFACVIAVCLVLAGHTGISRAGMTKKKKVYLKDYTPMNAAMRSAVFPGWGQYANHQEGKAYFISAAEVILISSALILDDIARDKYDEYRDKGIKDDDLFEDYETYHQASVVAGGVAASIWVYSIFEAYFFARDEIRRRDEYSWHIQQDGKKIMVSWKKRF